MTFSIMYAPCNLIPARYMTEVIRCVSGSGSEILFSLGKANSQRLL